MTTIPGIQTVYDPATICPPRVSAAMQAIMHLDCSRVMVGCCGAMPVDRGLDTMQSHVYASAARLLCAYFSGEVPELFDLRMSAWDQQMNPPEQAEPPRQEKPKISVHLCSSVAKENLKTLADVDPPTQSLVQGGSGKGEMEDQRNVRPSPPV